MALLEVKNLVKAFGGLRAVDDISFHVDKTIAAPTPLKTGSL